MQVINALHYTKGFPHETIIACAQLVQMDCEYCASFKTNKHLIYVLPIHCK